MRHLRLVLVVAMAYALVPAAELPAGELAFEGHAGHFGMAANSTAKAVYDSTGAPLYGGAVRFTLWRGMFVSAGVRSFGRDGERVFVLSPRSPVQKTGLPLSMRTTPVLVTAGYRLRDGRVIVPYLYAGAAITSYKVKSEVTGEPFDESLRKTGLVGAGGIEVRVLSPFLRLGGEVGYTTVPNAIGKDGVSKVYGEKDLGGWHAVGKLVVAFKL